MIGTKNRHTCLAKCLESVFDQTNVQFEVLILDDGSDTPVEIEKSLMDQHNVHLFRNETSMGVARGRNFLASKANGSYLFVLDDDAVFSVSDLLSKTAQTLGKDSEIAIVASKIIDHGINGETLFVPFSRADLKANPEIVDRGTYVSYYLGGGHAIRRDFFIELGGYSSELFFGEEELDFAYRTINCGKKIFYNPSLLIDHYPMTSVVSGGTKQELKRHIENRFFLAKKYLPYHLWPSYLTIWTTKYLARSLRLGCTMSSIGAIFSGLNKVISTARTPLNKEAIHYLKKNFGRLYY